MNASFSAVRLEYRVEARLQVKGHLGNCDALKGFRQTRISEEST